MNACKKISKLPFTSTLKSLSHSTTPKLNHYSNPRRKIYLSGRMMNFALRTESSSVQRSFHHRAFVPVATISTPAPKIHIHMVIHITHNESTTRIRRIAAQRLIYLIVFAAYSIFLCNWDIRLLNSSHSSSTDSITHRSYALRRSWVQKKIVKN